MPDTYLTLGGYTFTGFGVPERINGGGAQKLQVHKMLGGARVVDALGADDEPIAFRGRFRGANAMDDAMFMDAMRRAGTAVTLSYWNQTATVVVEKFTFSYERFYEVPYEISCVVVSSGAQQQSTPSPTVDSAVSSDIYQGAGAAAGDPACAAAFNALPTTYAANGPLSDATESAAGSISAAASSVLSSLGAISGAADVPAQSVNAAVVGSTAAGGLIDPLTAAASMSAFAALMSSGATAQITAPFAQRVALNIAATVGLVLR